jgi:hypothetical protein
MTAYSIHIRIVLFGFCGDALRSKSKEEEDRVLYLFGYKRYFENLLRPRFDPSVSPRSPVIHTVCVDSL